MFKPTFALVLAMTLTGCAATQAQYHEEIVDRITDQAGSRPQWLTKAPQQEGRLYLVTSSSDGLSLEVGTRLSKAYAFAQLSEQAKASVATKTQVSGQGGTAGFNESISWSSQVVFRSLRQDDIYWEKRRTSEGQRYSVWVLWSIPEKAFYDAQQEALAVSEN